MPGRANRRGFGYIRKLPSGRWQASYVGPDMARHSAGATFQSKQDGEAWLSREHSLVAGGSWTSPKTRRDLAARPDTFAGYAETWLLERDLKPRTRGHYRKLLDQSILADLGPLPIKSITPLVVRDWYSRLPKDTPTWRAHAYSLVRAIFATAVADEVVSSNPCHIRGAGSAKRAKVIRPATLDELAKLTLAMPEKYRAAVLISAWCGLRFGELSELRRRDIDLKAGVIRVRRAVTWDDSPEPIVGKPKSDAGVRDVAIPPHLMPAIKAHLTEHAQWGADGLIFPSVKGTHLRSSTLQASYWPARKKAGRPDLPWHGLRHTGAVLAAATGATLAELMARLGHSTPGAAMRYQHAAQGRDAEIAALLSQLAVPVPTAAAPIAES